MGAAGEFHVMDLREITFENAYHGIYNWLGSFGYFDDATNEKLLWRYARALRSGGRLLVEQPNRERILRHFVKEVKDGDLVQRNRWDSSTNASSLAGSSQGTKTRAMSPQCGFIHFNSCDASLKRAGLQVEAVYGSHAGGSFTRGSRRMLMVRE